jgi:hypothetical protein
LGVGVGVAVAIALAGCTTPISPQAPSTPPALSTLTVSPSGIGGLAIGRPITSFALVDYGPHTCPTTGGWLPRYSPGAATSSGQQLDPFDVVTRGGQESTEITREFVWSTQLATAHGIRVGSTLAAVVSAYPTAKRSTSYSTVLYAVPGTAGTLVIEVAGRNANAAGEWPAATLGTVVWMQVIEPGAKVESIANNNDAGPCPDKGAVPDDD